MSVEIVTPTEEMFPAIVAADGQAFGITYTPEDVEAAAAMNDLERFRVALDGSDIVGIAGSFEKELTLPGGAIVSCTAVTWVSVAVTHRRRGLLRSLMEAVHDDGAARGEAVLALTASEGAIYQRFGYGVATRYTVSSIDRRRTNVRDEYRPPHGSVRLVDPTAELDALVERYDRYRRSQPGELSRDHTWIRELIRRWSPGLVVALHDDGYAAWKVKSQWHDGHPAHELTVLDLVAATDDAHAALWSTVLSVDLVGPVRSAGHVALDDPLRHLIEDPRALRTTELNDHLWLRPVDIAHCFGSRSYRLDDRLVIELDDQRWEVSADGCAATDAAADLVLQRPAAGTLLLGGISASELARGRLLEARSESVLRRADAFFGWDPIAHCRTDF
ncbi:MAG: GNAT family N-acetyltransferase [Acidimicrobiales bacterium]